MTRLLALACLLAACAAPSRTARQEETGDDPLVLRERTVGVMGTELKITVLGPDAIELDAAIGAAIAEMRRVEDLMTTWRPSPLTDLNDHAGQGPRRAPSEIVDLVARSREISRLTGGAFDISFAGVGKLWDFKKKPPSVPSAERIKSALADVGYDRIDVDLTATTITLPAGMRIGLGGIAKGYGVDRATAVLMERGVEHAFVNAGGDLKALGRKRGKPWRIAIKHPRDRNRVLAVLPVSNRCVVTSGDYERFFEHEGRRYHHILDPRTGYPSTGCMAATVVGPDAAFADALATALCVLSPREGVAIVNDLPRTEAIVIGPDGKVHMSAGLAESSP